MGDLTNKQIDQTYDGLIKTSDEQPIDGTVKNLQDGVGNDLPVQVSTTDVKFTGNADFTTATVTGISDTNTTYDLINVEVGNDASIRLEGSDATSDAVNLIAGTNVTLDTSQNNITINSAGGTNTTYDLDFVPDGNNATIELNGSDLTTDTISIVPGTNVTFDLGTPGEFTINASGGAAGLENGTGVDSLQSAANLTTNPANASGPYSIALGDGAGAGMSSQDNYIAIGSSANPGDSYGIAIGQSSFGGYFGTAIGTYASASGNSVAIGDSSTDANYGIALGNGARSRADYCITIGANAVVDDGVRVNTVVIGAGAGETKAAQYSTAVGSESFAVGSDSAAFGYQAKSYANFATAIGAGVEAFTENTVTLRRLQMLDYASLEFADDTDAAANGIPLGGVYHTAGTLKIRIV